MKLRFLLTGALLLFVGVSIAAMLKPPAKPVRPAVKAAPAAARQVIAYYFHGNARCPSCMKIEAWSGQAIRGNFVRELKNGRIAWRVVNVDEPDNQHYIQDYQLYTKSLVLVEMRKGKQVRWKNLPKVWELLGSQPAFSRYVTDETRAYLGKS